MSKGLSNTPIVRMNDNPELFNEMCRAISLN